MIGCGGQFVAAALGVGFQLLPIVSELHPSWVVDYCIFACLVSFGLL